MALRTVIYLRRSSNEKDESHQKYSLERQREEIFPFIERYNAVRSPEEQLRFDPEKDVIEEDGSAKEPGRIKFNLMIGEIHKNKYDVLLCTELSRLSRNAIDTGVIVQLLEKKHLKTIQAMDKVFDTTPTDKFTLGLFLSVAKYENDQRGINTGSGISNKKRKGGTANKAPMGYINKGELKGEKWVDRDPQTWDNVRTIWELFLSGNYSMPNIKKEADVMGITVRDAEGNRNLPVQTTYRWMLRNKYYAGYIQRTDRDTQEIEWIKGQHPAMVTEEEFERVQLILQSRGYKHQKSKDTPKMNSILSEILVCGKCTTEVNGIKNPTRMDYEDKVRYTCSHCKHRFTSASKRPCPECTTPISTDTKIDTNRYYRCGQRSSEGPCSHEFYGDGKLLKNIKAGDIEKYLDQKLSSLYISDKLFIVFKRQLYTLWLEKNDAVKMQKTEHRKQLNKLEDERIKIQRRGLDKEKMSGRDRLDYDHLLDRNKSDIDALEESIRGMREDDEERFEKAWQSLQALRDAKSILGNHAIGFEPKRSLLLSLVSNLKITDKKWEVIWKKPFDILAKAGIAKNAFKRSGTMLQAGDFNWLPILERMRTDWAQDIIELGREIKLTGYMFTSEQGMAIAAPMSSELRF